jgi:hypothetical protein
MGFARPGRLADSGKKRTCGNSLLANHPLAVVAAFSDRVMRI